MKQLLTLLIVLLPILGIAQVHLGINEKEIRDIHADKTFEVDYEGGEKQISTFMDYGIFYYVFDNETGLCNFCFQAIDEMDLGYLNGQVQVYNNKYEIISDTEWKTNLEGGGVLNIELQYDDEGRVYYFDYDNAVATQSTLSVPDADSELSGMK